MTTASTSGGLARPPGDQADAIDTVAAALARGLTRPRLRAMVVELTELTKQIRSGVEVKPRLDLALLNALRTLEALLAEPAITEAPLPAAVDADLDDQQDHTRCTQRPHA